MLLGVGYLGSLVILESWIYWRVCKIKELAFCNMDYGIVDNLGC